NDWTGWARQEAGSAHWAPPGRSADTTLTRTRTTPATASGTPSRKTRNRKVKEDMKVVTEGACMTKIIPQGSPASAEDVSGLLRIWMLWYALSAMPLIDLIALSADELAALVRDWGWPRYRTRQILRWLYQARITDIGAMTDLSHSDRTRLAAEARIGWLTPSEVLTSEDGTRKFIFPLEDGKRIESVLIPDTSSRSHDRLTLCLSTEVGCSLDCT